MNQKQFLIALAVPMIIGAIYFLFFRSGPITNYPSSGTDIVAFGDSLVAGYGSTAGNDLVSDLSHAIGQPIVNLGVSGDTSASALSRMNVLDPYHPKVVILLLGGNDFLQKIPSDTTYANLAAIIQNIQSRGAIVLLLGVRSGLLGEPFNAYYKRLASTYHTAYVDDVLSGIFGHPDLMFDEVHPNDMGYSMISARVSPVLQRLLK